MADWHEPPAHEYRWHSPHFRPLEHVFFWHNHQEREGYIVSIGTRYAWDCCAYHVYEIEMIGAIEFFFIRETNIRRAPPEDAQAIIPPFRHYPDYQSILDWNCPDA